jgi:hypothetical protein
MRGSDVKSFEAHAGGPQGPGAKRIKPGLSASREYFHAQVRGAGPQGREDRGGTIVREGLDYSLVEKDTHTNLLLATDGSAGAADGK